MYILNITAILAAGLILGGCTGEGGQTMESAENEMATEGNMEEAAPLPTNFVYIAHPVAEYEPWLAAYEAHKQARTDHGLSELWIYRDLDQKGVVHVLLAASDVEMAKHFLGMDDLASVMKNAGVTGEPTIGVMTIVESTRPETTPQSQYNLLVKHEVADWTAWKAVFDGHKPARDAAQLTLRGIARDVDNPNMLYMNFAVGDLKAARAFVASQDLKNAMAKAGVVGTPTIVFAETARSM